MKDFRSDLSDELSALTPPPLGDLVAEATRKGRRARRVRSVGQVAGSALALTAVAVLFGGQLHGTGGKGELAGAAAGGTPAATATASPSPKAATATASPSPTASPSGDQVHVSGAAVLATVLDALPAGITTSDYAANNFAEAHGQYGTESPVAQVNVHTAKGLGMMRIFVGTANPTGKCTADTGCRLDKYGQEVRVDHVSDNCIQNTLVSVRHADGTDVTVQMASCLAWDGKANKPGVVPLTEEQAADLAGNPAFHDMMTPAQGAAAAARFPSLPQIY
ncbi:hypothetical protein ABT095_30825 [Kitasatospora sp. NPDC002227]|uniref:hypothetical protein n=1 Tax=Kitasatospora sp. NPDC002227 TaxID=3154773 RepID=UPI00331866C4